MTIYAAHQPNFLPWFGYFYKITHCDVFVFLDDVQFSSGSYINRVKMLFGKQPKWATASIRKRQSHTTQLNQMFYSNSDWEQLLLRRFEHNYRNCAHGRVATSILESIMLHKERNVSKFNTYAIHIICKELGIDMPEFVLSSSLSVQSQSTQRLCDIGKAIGGNSYLSGNGASAYQENALFAAHNIQVCYSQMQHPTYPQIADGEFYPGMSILDTIANIGLETTKKLLMG